MSYVRDVTVIFDTDVMIWAQRGNVKAVKVIRAEKNRALSVQTYMELLQGAQSRSQQDIIKAFLRDFSFRLLPLTEKIGHRACVYVEQFSLSHGVRSGDAVIAATATENDEVLCSGKQKHFACIPDLKFSLFRA